MTPDPYFLIGMSVTFGALIGATVYAILLFGIICIFYRRKP